MSLRPDAPEEVDPAEAVVQVAAGVVAAVRELAAAAFVAEQAARDHRPAVVEAESATVGSRIERQLAAAIGRRFYPLRAIALDPANQAPAIQAPEDRAAANRAQAIPVVANRVGTSRALAYRVAEIGQEMVTGRTTEIGPETANRVIIDPATAIGPETVRAMEIDLVIGRGTVIVRATGPAMVTVREMVIDPGTVQGMAIVQVTDLAMVTARATGPGAETVRGTAIDRHPVARAMATVRAAGTPITGTAIGTTCITVGTTVRGTGTGITAARIGTPIHGEPGATRPALSD
jgi:hypothetical protein